MYAQYVVNIIKEAVFVLIAITIKIGTMENNNTVIQGWVAIDEPYNECYLHTNKPTHEVRPIADAGDYESHWGSERLTYLQTYLLDADLFPDMDSDSEPQECEIIIKRKKNG